MSLIDDDEMELVRYRLQKASAGWVIDVVRIGTGVPNIAQRLMGSHENDTVRGAEFRRDASNASWQKSIGVSVLKLNTECGHRSSKKLIVFGLIAKMGPESGLDVAQKLISQSGARSQDKDFADGRKASSGYGNDARFSSSGGQFEKGRFFKVGPFGNGFLSIEICNDRPNSHFLVFPQMRLICSFGPEAESRDVTRILLEQVGFDQGATSLLQGGARVFYQLCKGQTVCSVC
jgi:hypothetical protein